MNLKKIIVSIKQVPESRNVKMDETTGTVIREGVQSIINPLDLYAIEFALRLKRRTDAEVIAISMGPENAEKALKEAISMGCDDAVLLSDKVFGGSDTWATSLVISKAVKKIGDVDLVICGERATDGDTGQVGPGIAAFMNWPVITYLSSLAGVENDGITVERMVETGHELLKFSVPMVLTVVKEAGEPRLPRLLGKIKARKMVIPVYDHKDLKINPEEVGLNGSPTRVRKIFKPPVARSCQIAKVDEKAGSEVAVEKLFEFLGEKGLYNYE